MTWLRRWHALLVIPAWLLAISVLGAADNRNCVEQMQMRSLGQTSVPPGACPFPTWRHPLRGLEWTWPPDAVLGYWLVSLVFAVVVALLVLRATKTSDGAR